MAKVTLDTETFLLCPGLQAPPIVCVQWSVGQGDPDIALAKDFEETAWRLLKNYSIHGHNIAFDMACICATWPRLLPFVFAAYEEDRITCTMLRARLIDLAKGRPLTLSYALDECARRAHLSQIPDKSDEWRLKYGTLASTPVDQWPPAARRYAIEDVLVTRDLYDYQEQYSGLLEDQHRQARAAFMLNLVRCWGIRTDLSYVKRYHAKTLEAFERDREVAIRAGLVRHDGTRDTKRAREMMVDAFRRLGEDPPLTKTGQEKLKSGAPMASLVPSYVALDEDACESSGDEALKAYQRFGAAGTTLGRVERLYLGTRLPIQARFETLVETGRTSCSQGEIKPGVSPSAYGFQLQNLPARE